MKAGYNGRIAVFWSQTEIDGLEAAPLAELVFGVAWSWHGRVTRLPEAGPQFSGQSDFGDAMTALAGHEECVSALMPMAELATIVLTNGAQRYEAELAQVEGKKDLVLLFENGCPARGQEFWVCSVLAVSEVAAGQTAQGNIVTFPVNRPSVRQTLVLSPQMAAAAAE